MGGFIFIAGVLAATLFMARDTSTLIVLICAVGFGLIGFIDDFIKVILKRNLGLTALQKLALQIALAVAFVITLNALGLLHTDIILPFVKEPVNLGWFYVAFAVFIMVGLSMRSI